MPIPLILVFEDDLSEFVLNRLVNSFGDKFTVSAAYNGHGFGYIKSNINGFNEASRGIAFLVLTDLDSRPCPIELIADWFKRPVHNNMIFRIAVKEVEAWLLADIDGYSEFTGVSSANFPLDPESESDPKQTLINITRKSRKRHLRQDIIPLNENARIGPNYNGRLMEFISKSWNIQNAMDRSESLRRAYHRLRDFEYSLAVEAVN